MFNLGLSQKIEKILEKIEDFAKDTDNRLDSLEKVALKQEINLQEHMKRSDHLEEMIKLESARVEIVTKHVSMVEGALKMVGIVSIIVGIVVGISRLV
jgi:hypothetical protein